MRTDTTRNDEPLGTPELGGAIERENPPGEAPVVSIVVPTRNEEGNVGPLTELLGEVLRGTPAEVIFVDDSDDGTPDRVRAAARRSQRRIRLVHRPRDQRHNGLGGAVLEGFRAARGDWVCVMDGDLQHPPQLIERLLEKGRAGDLDMVVASRFRPEGDADQFGAARRALSWAGRHSARVLFPGRLRNVTDPMSGFFLVRRSAVDVERLRPRGFKILLEILVRTPRLRVGEVGFHFGRRLAGESKAGVREAARYGAQLVSARVGDRSLRLAGFAVIGLSGLVVNTLVLALLTERAQIFYAVSAVLATQFSTAWNFVLTDRWLFRDRRAGRPAGDRAAMFFATNNAAMLLRIPALVVLTSGMGIHYVLSNVLTLAALMLTRFAVADTWIWSRTDGAAPRSAPSWRYDIHGIITVASEAPLPELTRFLVDELVERPTINVRVGGATSAGPDGDGGPARIRYREPLGFCIDIEMGEQIDVRASRLLAHSPHVLYTNVVEPILRWAFAERGYALVHAACIADGDRALLITARTDTGKTTTCLKLLDSGPYRFVSDDLTLLCPDGRVLTYPKPLTISRHTLHAVSTPLLRRRERMTLVAQSRLHSRSGRRLALLLARTHLPSATINAITQILIPPPKYQVDRLVPGVGIASEAKVEAMVVLQRGGEGEVLLEPDEALATLLENCEDAYGFPPYHDIEQVLHSRDGARLQDAERATIARGLAGTRATLLRSETMDWFRRLPAILGSAPQQAAVLNGSAPAMGAMPVAEPLADA